MRRENDSLEREDPADIRAKDRSFGEGLGPEEFILGELDSFFEGEKLDKFLGDKTAERCIRAYLDQFLIIENDAGQFEEVALEDGEIYVADPIFSAFIQLIAKESIKSKPAFDFITRRNDLDSRAHAKKASATARLFQQKNLTNFTLQQAALESLFHGEALFEVGFADGAGPDVKEPQWGQKQVELTPAGSRCAQCAAEAAPEMADQSCPACLQGGIQSPMQPVAAETAMKPAIVDYKEYKAGEPYSKLLSRFGACYNSWATCWKDVIWFRYDEIVDRAILRGLYPDADIEAGRVGDGFMHMSLWRKRSLERAQIGDSTDYLSGSTGIFNSDRDRCHTYDLLKPITYAHYTINERAVLPNGTDEGLTVEAGKSLLDYFPTGLKVCRIGEKIVGWYEADLHKTIVQMPYQVVNGRARGKSVAGALEIQEALNDVMTLIVTYVMESASPTTFIDESIIPDGIGISGKPALRIPAGKRQQDMPMSNLIAIIPPGNLNQMVVVFFEKLKEEMQAILGAWSPFGSGLPDAAGNTATGLSIAAEAASSVKALSLQLRGDALAEITKLMLWHYSKNVTDDRAIPSGPDGQSISVHGEDIDEDLEVTVIGNSIWPLERYQEKQNYEQFLMSKGNAMQMAAMVGDEFDLEQERYLGDLYGIDIGVDKAERVSEEAAARLKRILAKVDELSQGGGDVEDQAWMAQKEQMYQVQAIQQAMAQAPIAAQPMQGAAAAPSGAPPAMSQDAGPPAFNAPPPSGDAPPPPDTAGADPLGGAPPEMAGPAMPPIPPVDPDQLAIERAIFLSPPWENVDPHKYFRGYYKDYGLTDPGRMSTPIQRKAITQLIQLHFDLEQQENASKAGSAANAQMQAMAPIQQQQQQMDMQGALMQGLVSQATGGGKPPSSGAVPGGPPPVPPRPQPPQGGAQPSF